MNILACISDVSSPPLSGFPSFFFGTLFFGGIAEFDAHIIRDELVRASTLPLIVKLDKSPALAGKTAVRVAVGELDYWTIAGAFSLAESAGLTADAGADAAIDSATHSATSTESAALPPAAEIIT